nr:PREDICTED: extracellular calcium-sensing receptor-like [Lepisosteus oculatus]
MIGGVFALHIRTMDQTFSFTSEPEPPDCKSFHFGEFQSTQTMIFAIEEINNRTDLLPGIYLGYKIYDSCSLPHALRATMALINEVDESLSETHCSSLPTVQAIIGDSRSSHAAAIAVTVGSFNIPLMLEYLKEGNFTVKTGEKVFFDDNGDPVARYELVNWKLQEEGTLRFVAVGYYDGSLPRDRQFIMNEANIVWAGGQREKPESVCSESCLPGTRKAVQRGRPVCCYDCIRCAEGEISNTTDSNDCVDLCYLADNSTSFSKQEHEILCRQNYSGV